MPDVLTVAPTPDPKTFRLPDASVAAPPAGWAFLPAGDAGLTRRVKAAGPCWVVVEARGRKKFTRGVWADATTIERERAGLESERADPAYERKLAAAARRREKEQAAYVEDFVGAVRDFLAFAAPFAATAAKLAEAVTNHATPVGSGTVARTKRIPIGKRAEAAVLAWLRHQTTGYDSMRVKRVRGERRRVRRELAGESRRLLDRHRRPDPHPVEGCPLCRAVSGASFTPAPSHRGPG
jgi:hypothetical protein